MCLCVQRQTLSWAADEHYGKNLLEEPLLQITRKEFSLAVGRDARRQLLLQPL